MQYRNLNLDKLQAFAPERKLIDKENIYNTFLGLGDAFQKGADAHTLNEIYQLSPDEQQRKMAEYRAYKGDFSGFDNIEQAKLRQAEMNALKEQQRADKEEAEEASKREDFKTRHNLEVDNTRIIALLRQGRRESSDRDIQRLDLETYAREHAPDLFALLENNNHFLKTLGGNVTPLSPQIYKKGVEASVTERKTEGNSESGSNENLDFKKLDYNTEGDRDAVLQSDYNYISNLDDNTVKILHDYIDKQLKPISGKYILDTDLNQVLNKYKNEYLHNYIKENYIEETEKQRKTREDKLKKQEELKATERNVANAIKNNSGLFGKAPDGYTNKQVINWAVGKAKERDPDVQDKLAEIFNDHGYKIEEGK